MSAVILFIVCLVLIYLNFKAKKKYWQKRNVVQVNDLMLKFIFSHRSMPEICKTIYDEHDTRYIGTTVGGVHTLILKNTKDIQAVLAFDFLSFHCRGILTNPNDILADNILFTNDYKRWKILRFRFDFVFHIARLKSMYYTIEKCARDFVDLVEDNIHLRRKSFKVVYTYTTGSIGAALCDIDTQTRNPIESPFMDMARKSLAPTMYMNTMIIIGNLFPSLFKLLKLKLFGTHEKFFVDAVKSVMLKRMYDKRIRRDFIEICLLFQSLGMLHDFFTHYELSPTCELLAAQAFSFFVSGADTTANAMHFILLELANNSKILSKLHAELDAAFVNNVQVLSYNDLEKLHYLDQIVSEGLRKYPPIGVIQRLCTRDTILPSGLPIRKNTVMLVPIYALHRDEKYYPNPEEFNPERFSPKNVSNIKKYTYLPFGEGKRNCMGARFARLQMKAGLAWLLRRFTLTEQNYTPKTFERSTFGLRRSDAGYELKLRDYCATTTLED